MLTDSPRVTDIEHVQTRLRERKLDGWLLVCGRSDSKRARVLLGLSSPVDYPYPSFYFIPAYGIPIKLTPLLFESSLAHLEGEAWTYAQRRSLAEAFKVMLSDRQTIAMEISLDAEIPDLDHASEIWVSMISSLGVKVESSLPLSDPYLGTWLAGSQKPFQQAGAAGRKMVDEALAYIWDEWIQKNPLMPAGVSAHLEKLAQQHGLILSQSQVTFGAATWHPYPALVTPPPAETPLQKGDLIRLDFVVRNGPSTPAESPPAVRIIWMAALAKTIRKVDAERFGHVTRLRDIAMESLSAALQSGQAPSGAAIDAAVRSEAKKLKLDTHLFHDSGYHLDDGSRASESDGSGFGARFESERHDDSRVVQPATGYVIAPGVYYPEQAGYRSAVNVWVTPSYKLEVISGPPQQALVPLLG